MTEDVIEAQALMQWYGSGGTDISSKTIAHVLAGVPVERREPPYDPSDFRCCVDLLDHMALAGFNWRARLGEVAKARPRWALLVEHWAELEESLRAELAESHRAPHTYARMQELI